MHAQNNSLSPLQIQPTLADVLARLRNANVSERRRKDLASDIRSFCRIVQLPADQVIASATHLRPLTQRVRPAANAISPARLSNIFSGLRRALQLTGTLPGTFRLLPRPNGAWEELLILVPSPKRRIVFLRFARYCTALGITPEQVDDALIAEFQGALDEHSFRDSTAKIGQLCRAWNKAAVSIPNWPEQRLRVPLRVNTYTLPWSAFPESLRADVERYLAQRLAPDLLDPDASAPLRPASILSFRQTLRELAGARVTRGTSPEDIHSLADLVRPAELRDALTFFVERAGNPTPNHLLSLFRRVVIARSIARNYLKLPESELVDINRICKLLYRRLPTRRGLTETNKRRLNQFLDEKKVQALYDLPLRLRAHAERSPVDLRSALTMQSAVAIELFSTTLVRSRNIRCLSYSKNFLPARFQGHQLMHLVIPAKDVKNSVDLEFPLSKRTTELLRSYMDTYQPVLSRGHKTDLLFPGNGGKPKAQSTFAQQIVEAILEKTGIQMNPHLFRHLGALLFLGAHPGEYETMRRVLAHKSIETTTKFYVGLESIAAFRRYDETVLKHRTAGTWRARSTRC